jgi:dynein assembly factor 5
MFQVLIDAFDIECKEAVAVVTRKFSKELIDICVRNGIWKAGQKNTVIRGQAMKLLSIFQKKALVEPKCIIETFKDEMFPVLISNLDDDLVETRRSSVAVLSSSLLLEEIWDADLYKKLYPELLKRMDDANDNVRTDTAALFALLFDKIGIWQSRWSDKQSVQGNTILEDGEVVEIALDDVHYDTILKGLTVHMDDTNPEVQKSVCEALKVGYKSCLPETMVRDYFGQVRHSHRFNHYFDNILSNK